MKTIDPKDTNPNFPRADISEGGREHGKFWVSIFAIPALIFSCWLMFHTFSYDAIHHNLLISSKAWSDFGAHIPLIRSFSYGPNLSRLFHNQTVESPLFPGKPIRYYFGFYLLVALLEKLGMRIDWALNIPSALGFFFLLVGIYVLAKKLFQKTSVALLSVLFFLCNGSLSFLRFFQSHTLFDIVTNSMFPSFGPWDGGDITAFWNLNIYTNQRHLALSYALVIAAILLALSKKKSVPLLVGTAAALLFVSYPSFAIMGVILLWIFLLEKSSRVPLVVAGIITIPALLFLRHVAHLGSNIVWLPGYLSNGNFIRFWFDNLGLHIFLIPLGLLLSPKRVRTLLIGPLLILFLLPNLFRFSPDMINNHKFFNFFLIIGSMVSAYAITRISSLRTIGKTLAALIIFFCILSGIIDFFPVMNDYYGTVPDIQASRDEQFFLAHTKPTDVIADSTWFYHPASIAGRSLFSGYTYFTWSYGYDQVPRENTLKALYAAPDAQTACTLIRGNNIAYVELNGHPESYLSPNWQLWSTLTPVYQNPETHLRVFSENSICD